MKRNLRGVMRGSRRARMRRSAGCSEADTTRSSHRAQRVRLMAYRGGVGKNHIVDSGDKRERQTVRRHLLPASPR